MGVSWALATQSIFFTKTHFWLIDGAFAREQKATVAGQVMFARKSHAVKTSSFLRRSIHRIEKGLVSRPRREIFAEDYIVEVVEEFSRMRRQLGSLESAELWWSNDVLRQYFDKTGNSVNIDEARRRFRMLGELNSTVAPTRATERSPYRRGNPKSPTSFENLLKLAQQRRSVRWFKDTPIDRGDIHKALEIATLSPSACNRQPFRFHIFDQEPFLSSIASLPPGTRGYEHNFPCIIAVIGQQRYYSELKDRHLIYIDGSLATMSFILALETLGLSSCCINWPDIEERESAAEKSLKLEPDERIVMFIAAGYADPEGLIPYSEKRTAVEICRFNFE